MLAGKPRAPTVRNLAVFRFVVDRLEIRAPSDDEDAGTSKRTKRKKPKLVRPCSRRELMGLWNREYPRGHEWHYEDARNFHNDFRRAEQAVVHPRYRTRVET